MPSFVDNSEELSLVVISFDCDLNSRVLLGVLDCQVVGLMGGGVGVRGWTLRVDITASGSNGTRPAARKLDRTFFSIKHALNASWKAGIKVILSIWWMWLRAKAEMLLLYFRFSGEKQPTSNSWRMWDECA